MNNKFTKTLLSELPVWVKNGYINQEQSEKISKHYETKSSNFHYFAFSIIGVFFISLGLISLVAHNWDNLSKFMRFCLAIMPLIVAQILAFYIIFKNKSKIWNESIGLFWFFSFGLALALIGQTYHLDSSLKDFYLVWVIFTLPIIFILKSDLLAICSLLILSLWFEYNAILNEKIIFIALFFIWFIYYFYRAKQDKNSNLFFLLSSAFIVVLLLKINIFEQLVYWYIFIFIAFYYIDYIYFKELVLLKRVYAAISRLGIGILSIILLVPEYTHGIFPDSNTNSFILASMLSILSLLIFIYFYYKKKDDDILYPIFGFVSWIFVTNPNLTQFYGIFFIIILSSMIYKNTINLNLLRANYAMLLLIFGLLFKFINTYLSLIIQGFIFIIIGIYFLYMNIFIKNRKKN